MGVGIVTRHTEESMQVLGLFFGEQNKICQNFEIGKEYLLASLTKDLLDSIQSVGDGLIRNSLPTFQIINLALKTYERN